MVKFLLSLNICVVQVAFKYSTVAEEIHLYTSIKEVQHWVKERERETAYVLDIK